MRERREYIARSTLRVAHAAVTQAETQLPDLLHLEAHALFNGRPPTVIIQGRGLLVFQFEGVSTNQ
jgi:hypothetical protein